MEALVMLTPLLSAMLRFIAKKRLTLTKIILIVAVDSNNIKYLSKFLLMFVVRECYEPPLLYRYALEIIDVGFYVSSSTLISDSLFLSVAHRTYQ